MARYLVKQPDGKYAIYSTIVDSFLVWDATLEEIRPYLEEEAIKKAKEQVADFIDSFTDKQHPRYNFVHKHTYTYKQCLENMQELNTFPEGFKK